MKLHFVTSNQGKVVEAQLILGYPIQITPLELPEIQSLNLEEIVTEKVKFAYKQMKQPVFVDDVGLFVTTWNGFPGPFIKFLIQSGKNDLLLKMMSQETNREVIARAAIGFHDGNKIHTFLGEVTGFITERPKGENGWGWDPIFVPKGADRTYAEMSAEVKNSLSHRRAALDKFKAYLDKRIFIEIRNHKK